MNHTPFIIPVHTFEDHPIPIILHKDIPQEHYADYIDGAKGNCTTHEEGLYYYDTVRILNRLNIPFQLVDAQTNQHFERKRI